MRALTSTTSRTRAGECRFGMRCRTRSASAAPTARSYSKNSRNSVHVRVTETQGHRGTEAQRTQRHVFENALAPGRLVHEGRIRDVYRRRRLAPWRLTSNNFEATQ